MDSTRWTRVRAVLEAALERDPSERSAWVRAQCDGDENLRQEVESLLEQNDEARELAPPDPARLSQALSDPNLGRRIGPYVIESRLGSGGMGTVYFARRSADFEQHVALKLIKRGMDTDEVLQRFRNERNVLATLEHPCIARLIDGGATDDGSPWIAMELVEGVPIDTWCDGRAASLRERIELFATVCDAVQHAHQHLVIHRDLKPSNILVTADGVPKLVDFGIAKVLDQDSPGSTQPTLSPQRPLTPDYASPEQLRGETVTTSSDVYSLGVLLYALLSGALPFADALARSESARSPGRPSTRAGVRAASARSLDERGLRKALDGDLDTIALTALAEDPRERYASAEALAADLRRYLDGRAILARPPTALYFARKFVARNKLAVAAALTVLVALVGGLLAAYVGYRRAETQRADADLARKAEGEQRTIAQEREASAKREAAKANAVLDLVQRMLGSASPYQRSDRDYTVRQLLDDFDANLGKRELDPQVEAAVRTTMGNAYREIGLLDKARVHLARARELDRAAPSDDSTQRLLLLANWIDLLREEGDYAQAENECGRMIELANELGLAYLQTALYRRGSIRLDLGRLADSEADLRRSLEIGGSLAHPDLEERSYSLQELARNLVKQGRIAEAESDLDSALDAALRTQGPASVEVGAALMSLSYAFLEGGRQAEAEVFARCGLDIQLAALGTEHATCSRSLASLGVILMQRGAWNECESALRKAGEIEQDCLGPDHPSVATCDSSLASALERMGRFAEAEELYRDCLRIRQCSFEPNHPDVASICNNLGLLLTKRGRLDEAQSLLEHAVAIRRELGDAVGLSRNLANLSGLMQRRGRMSEAIALQRESIDILRRRPDASELELASGIGNLSALLLQSGDPETAAKLQRESLDIRVRVLGEDHVDVAKARSNLGLALVRLGRNDEAEPLLRRALEDQRRWLGDQHVDVGRTAWRLAEALDGLGRHDEAIERAHFAAAALRTSLGNGHPDALNCEKYLAALIEASAKGQAEPTDSRPVER